MYLIMYSNSKDLKAKWSKTTSAQNYFEVKN